MSQEIQINLNVTLDTDSDLTKNEIAEAVEAAFNTVFTSLNVPLSSHLSKYNNGAILQDIIKIQVFKVQNEADIYKLE